MWEKAASSETKTVKKTGRVSYTRTQMMRWHHQSLWIAVFLVSPSSIGSSCSVPEQRNNLKIGQNGAVLLVLQTCVNVNTKTTILMCNELNGLVGVNIAEVDWKHCKQQIDWIFQLSSFLLQPIVLWLWPLLKQNLSFWCEKQPFQWYYPLFFVCITTTIRIPPQFKIVPMRNQNIVPVTKSESSGVELSCTMKRKHDSIDPHHLATNYVSN